MLWDMVFRGMSFFPALGWPQKEAETLTEEWDTGPFCPLQPPRVLLGKQPDKPQLLPAVQACKLFSLPFYACGDKHML